MSLTNFNKILTWNDFNKLSVRPPGKSEDAVISATWRIDADQLARKGNAIILEKYTVEIYLVADNCTVLTGSVTGPKSAELLKHEQGHFDIIALGAREFNNKVSKLSASTEIELTKKIDELNKTISDKTNVVDERYDTVTNHSMNTSVQQTWDQKIDAAKKNPKGTVEDLP